MIPAARKRSEMVLASRSGSNIECFDPIPRQDAVTETRFLALGTAASIRRF
jgi:hypothetical protein